MRTFFAFVGSLMGSVAFQLSVAIWPNQFQHYAFLVKWVWIGCGLFWLAWLLSHPWIRRHVYARAAIFPPSQSPVMPLPTPQPSTAAKPSRLTHKVKCVGVIAGEKAAKIGFVNVEIPDQEVGNFRKARLKIRYILAASGEEVATVFPARWIDSDEDAVSVEFVPRYAALAVYIGNRWHGVETVEVFTPQSEIESHYSRELRPLPSTQLKIEATLIGERNLSLKPFTGVLTLNESGNASFLQDSIERLAH
jgi:hypothetical protein